MTKSPDARIELLMHFLDQAFDHKSWHGTTLRGSLRGLDVAAALWRPAPGRHNIWELVVHTAYWKYAVRQRLDPSARGAFPRRPSNWPRLPDVESEKNWRQDVALLEQEHRLLRSTVERLSPRDLVRRSPRGTWTYAEEIHGVAAHDLYHTGQIQLLKRLQK